MVRKLNFCKRATQFGFSTLLLSNFLTPPVWAASSTLLLNPKQVPQFVELLPNPLDPKFIYQPDEEGGSHYTLQITEFTQALGLAAPKNSQLFTTLWGYGTASQSGTFPGRTFEVQQGNPISVTFVNKLLDASGAPLPNRMPVDTTLDWANPGAVGGLTPVPAVAHLHGSDSPYLSDGLPDAWTSPFDSGRTGNSILSEQQGRLFSQAYLYENKQEAGTLWYHDHALGITRTNVYMGLAGFYILRDDNENSLRRSGVLPSYPYEIPLVIQDRLFNADGSLNYPSTAPGMPNPTHLPEFYGDVVLVNGKAWPKMDVEPRKYRLRMLNGSDSRFYDMKFEYFLAGKNIMPGSGVQLPLMVIGNELGLLNQPASPTLDTPVGGKRSGAANILPIAPGERYDVIVDFSNVPMGASVVITNSARSPYPDAVKRAHKLLDRLMAFNVVLPRSTVPNASVTSNTSLRPLSGNLASTDTANVTVRRIMLYEGTDTLGRLQTMIGPIDADPVTGQQGTLTFKDPVSEHPKVNTQEVWEFYNTTVDAHPVHMHLVDFRTLDRQTFTATLTPKINSDSSNGGIIDTTSIVKTGNAIPANSWESGKKDTVISFPGEVTRVLVSFNRKGEYVYHCHIISHEDHEMMRPYQVE